MAEEGSEQENTNFGPVVKILISIIVGVLFVMIIYKVLKVLGVF